MIAAIEFAGEVAIVLSCIVASLFAIAGTVGLFRFPDFYSRLQASSLTGTVAVFTSFITALLISPDFPTTARIVLVMAFFLLSNPTTTHIIARYAWRSGIDPWAPRKDA